MRKCLYNRKDDFLISNGKAVINKKYTQRGDIQGNIIRNVFGIDDPNVNLYKLYSMIEPQYTGKRRAMTLLQIEMKFPYYLKEGLFNPCYNRKY